MATKGVVLVSSISIILATLTLVTASSDSGKFDALLKRVEQLEERDILQKNDLHHLRVQLQSEKRRTQALESIVHRLNAPAMTSNLNDDVVDIDVTDTEPRRDGNPKLKEGERLENRIRRADNEDEVAFFASLINHQMNIGTNQSVLFDQIVTNTGNAYNPQLGAFTAPVAGTYLFSATLMEAWHNDAHYTIAKNGVAVSHIHSYAKDTDYDSASQTIVLVLSKGDDVTVRNAGTTVHAHSTYSSFTGILVQEHYGSPIIG